MSPSAPTLEAPTEAAPAAPVTASMVEPKPARKPPRLSRRRKRIIGLSALGAVLVLSVGALFVIAAMRSAPPWWRTVLREDPATIKLANVVENSLINMASSDWPADRQGTGHSKPWTVEVNAQEVNAWLNVRLPMWLANQKDQFRWPRNMSDLQVEFSPDAVTIGARVQTGERAQVVTATLRPSLDEEGRLYTRASSVNVGRLPIPASWVLDTARNSNYIPPELRKLPETEALLRAFDGDGPLVQRAVMRLNDGRRVRILAVQAREGVLRVTCRTER